MKVPYRPESKQCYDRLRKTRPVFQAGIQEIRKIAESPSPFSERLRRILDQNQTTVEESRKERSPVPWMEEDVYICCLYDLLDGIFSEEANKISSGTGAAEEKRKAVEGLIRELDQVPLANPKWNRGAQPAIRKNLKKIANQM